MKAERVPYGETCVAVTSPDVCVLTLRIPKISSWKKRTSAITSGEVKVGDFVLHLEVVPRSAPYVLPNIGVSLIHDDHSSTKTSVLGRAAPVADITLRFLYRRSRQKFPGMVYASFRPQNRKVELPSTSLPHRHMWGSKSYKHIVLDTLVVRAEIKLLSTVGPESTVKPTASLPKMKDQSTNTSMLLASDFVFVSSDGAERQVHKKILSEASTVLRGLIESSKPKSRYVFRDLSTKVMDVLLRYVYFGRASLEGLDGNEKDVLLAAQKYQLAGLKKACEDKFKAGINANNMGDLLMWADEMKATDLKRAVLDYIGKNAENAHKSGAINKIMDEAVNGKRNELVKELFALVFTSRPK